MILNRKGFGKKFINIFNIVASLVTIIGGLIAVAGYILSVAELAMLGGAMLGGAFVVLIVFFIINKIKKLHCITDEINAHSKKITKHLQHASFEIAGSVKKRLANQLINAKDVNVVKQASEKFEKDVDDFLKDCIREVNDLLRDSVQKIVKQQFNVEESFRVIFKLVDGVNASDDPMSWKVENFVRDGQSLDDDKPKIGTENSGVIADYSVLPAVIGKDSQHYFACDNLIELANIGAYNNGLNSDWKTRYNAKMLVPVWNKDEFETYGFLSIDCLNKGHHKIFRIDEKTPNNQILNLLEQAADSLFIVLFLVKNLIKEVDRERESALVRIQAGNMRKQSSADEISIHSKKIMKYLLRASFEIAGSVKKRLSNQLENAKDVNVVEQASKEFMGDIIDSLEDCIRRVNDLLRDSAQKIMKQQFNVEESFRVIFKRVRFELGDGVNESDESYDPMKWRVENYVRDSQSMDDDKPKIGAGNAGVLANYSILPAVIGKDSQHYFAYDNLIELAREGAYSNGLNSDWQTRYNAKMLVPVWNKDEFETYGFLSIDCLNKDNHKIFRIDEKTPNNQILNLLEQAADSLFIVLFLVKNLIKEVDRERESALARIQAGRLNTRQNS